jgi:nicotinamide-nucleotide amidase
MGDMRRTVHGLPLAFLPGWEGVDLRVTARGLPADQADATLERAVHELRDKAGDTVYAEGNDDLADAVLQALRARGWRAAVAESCTGGMLGQRLTAIAGSSEAFVGGVIAYSNDVKVRDLGVNADDIEAHGAVSETVALQMASGVRGRTGADVGLAITGVAGPGGGTEEKPVGTVWMAIDTPLGARAVMSRLIGDRDEIRRRATQGVMNMLRKALAAS